MMDLSGISRIIISGLAGGAAVWLLNKFPAAPAGAENGQTGSVEYGRGVKIQLCVYGVITALLDYAALHAREDQRLPAYSLAIVLTAAICYLIVEMTFTRITYDDVTIRLFSPWRRAIDIPWKSIEHYQWSRLSHHTFYTNRDAKIRLSEYMIGLDAFFARAFAILKEKYPARFAPPSAQIAREESGE